MARSSEMTALFLVLERTLVRFAFLVATASSLGISETVIQLRQICASSGIEAPHF